MRSSVPFHKTVKFRIQELFSWPKFFFTYKIPYFFKFTLWESMPHILSVSFALISIFACFKNIVWLVVVSSIASFISRLAGFIKDRDLGILDMLSLLLLLLVPAGFFLIRFLWKLGIATSFFLSLSASILLVYAINVLIRTVPYILMSIISNILVNIQIRNEKKAAVEYVLENVGFTKKQVKRITVDSEKYEGEWYYMVTFIRGDKQYSCRVKQRS